MLNLAPLYYLNIMREDGGPIEEVNSSRANIDFQNEGYKTLVRLSPNYTFSTTSLKVYSDWDGTGSDKYLKISFFKAVSEALERWAFYESYKTPQYGFDFDKTTNGMAAFPSPLKFVARKNALMEAFERWTLIHWWKGFISLKERKILDGVESFSYQDPKLNLAFVLHHKKCPNGMHSYGFAGGSSVAGASNRAVIELKRNYDLLSSITIGIEVSNVIERRLFYFSSLEGHKLFNEKVRQTIGTSVTPKLIVNTEIKGPWTKYAKVWRCLFEPTVEDDPKRDDIFLF